MQNDINNAILDVVRACDAAVVALCGGDYPDARHMSNAMNRAADDLTLNFMTSRTTRKFDQIMHNNHCCLYFFDANTRHAVRLYGDLIAVTDIKTRRAKWNPEYSKFGYSGPDDGDFVLLQFAPKSYKYYVGPEMKTGAL